MADLNAMLSAVAGAAGGGATYIEDVFSTYLYTGNGSTQTITNGIDLSGEGGMTWIKRRDSAGNNFLFDTVRGVGNTLFSDDTSPQVNFSASLTSFDANGFSLGSYSNTNGSTRTFASWTFRKAEKFFDVVTWTGDGTSNRQISHSLGSTPGCVIVKNTSSASDWPVYHRSLGFSTGGSPYNGLILNGTTATGTYDPPISAASSTTITVTTSGSNTNQNGQTFVAYLFAHDAGGFGDAGDQNVISCGSYVGNGSTNGPTITLGYEPQWILVKNATGAADWWIVDNMRGMPVGGNDWRLRPNTSDADNNGDLFFAPTATGFKLETLSSNVNTSGSTYIYIAIRRGPMKTPEAGTEVFSPGTATGNGVSNTFTTNFPVDLSIDKTLAVSTPYWIDRLRGGTQYLASSSTAAEGTYASNLIQFDSNTTIVNKNYGSTTSQYVDWMFRRAPGFFDVVCYTGNGSFSSINHNLTVTPELIITKARNNSQEWWVDIPNGDGKTGQLQSTAAWFQNWSAGQPTATSSVFMKPADTNTYTYVAYLFATCPGVSKVGSYTGTGAAIQVNCGFTNGARFILIKRTDSTGNWYVWDSARGIVAGNDPYLLLNATNAEAAPVDTVDTYSAGFEVASTAGSELNANGGTFIFLAIA